MHLVLVFWPRGGPEVVEDERRRDQIEHQRQRRRANLKAEQKTRSRPEFKEDGNYQKEGDRRHSLGCHVRRRPVPVHDLHQPREEEDQAEEDSARQ